MNWPTYRKNFTKLAQEQNYPKEYITRCLAYAHGLHRRGLPVIFDQTHLSLLVGYRVEFLRKISNRPELFYRSFTIPKRTGGKRSISEPLPSLKEIQRWILTEILEKCSVSDYAKAYVKGKSIKDNARFHRNQKRLLTMDISDFFGSITGSMVYHLFRRMGYSRQVSAMLRSLCCLDGSLPQGAITSPSLSNLVTVQLDHRLYGFSRKFRVRYTRYADDLTFSGDFDPGMMIRFVTKALASYGMEINNNKTRVRSRAQRQEVTGIVVNTKMQVPRETRRKLRQVSYYIEKFGLNSHLDWTGCDRAHYLYHILGIANHAYYINPNDRHVREIIERLRSYIVVDN